MKPRIVSIAIGQKFLPFADRLEANAKAFGFETYIFRSLRELSRGVDAWRLKPSLMIPWLDQGPVLFVDVDTLFRRVPDFDQFDGEDLAAYYSHPHLHVLEDTVLYANPTPGARIALGLWAELLKNPKLEWTNLELSKAVLVAKTAVAPLPPTYCWNEKWLQTERFGPLSPVIQPNAEDP
jgi:hypothetical protein